ncbi:MAG: sporulation initiation factor Spo0A C-terminal domain-containing protein [Bacilli bacterium]|nr:sporulation initiation factor Spo0A C-terminal domain-containing protein [Bacilli bacterium]
MKRGDVINILNNLGASPKYLGYNYIVDESVLIDAYNAKKKKVLLKEVHSVIANKYSKRGLTVERDIRSCIEGTFKNGNLNYIYELFFGSQAYYQERPSNKLFLTTIVNYLNKDE